VQLDQRPRNRQPRAAALLAEGNGQIGNAIRIGRGVMHMVGDHELQVARLKNR